MDSNTKLTKYLQSIKSTLEGALCLRKNPSQLIEKQYQPEVEMHDFKKLVRNGDVTVSDVYLTNGKESCLIEGSINSVRVSVKYRLNDELDLLISEALTNSLEAKADQFEIIRKHPITGYSITFLITYDHLQRYSRNTLLNFVCNFIANIGEKIRKLKTGVNEQAGKAVKQYLKSYVVKGK